LELKTAEKARRKISFRSMDTFDKIKEETKLYQQRSEDEKKLVQKKMQELQMYEN